MPLYIVPAHYTHPVMYSGEDQIRAGVAEETLPLGDLDHRLGVAALVALDEALDESLEHLRELARVMRAVDDRQAGFLLVLGLRAKLASEVLGRVARRTSERLGVGVQAQKPGSS